MQGNFENSSNERLSWVPIFKSDTQNGDIVMRCLERNYEIKDLKNYMYCYRLLEIIFNDVIKTLVRNYGDRYTEIELIQLFLFKEIVEFIFMYNRSDYWVGLALNWFEEFDITYKMSLMRLFEMSVNDKRISQKNRHRIRREISSMNKRY